MTPLLGAISAASAIAQIQSARLEGTVQDSSGASVPGAKLAIVNTKTQVRIVAESDAVGAYSFLTLTPGFYELSAEAGGFLKITVANIEVNIGVTIRQNLKMELGTVTDTILVESSSVRVQTSEASPSRTSIFPPPLMA